MHTTIAEGHAKHQAQMRAQTADALVLDACQKYVVCLPAGLESALAEHLALKPDNTAASQQALETTARLWRSIIKPNERDALRVWSWVCALCGADQNHLVTLIEALYPSIDVAGDRLDTTERLAQLHVPLKTAVEAWPGLKAVLDKAQSFISTDRQLLLLYGWVGLQEQAFAVQTVCLESELDAQDVAGLLQRFTATRPASWLQQARTCLLQAQEFVTINIDEVPRASHCVSPNQEKRLFRVFPPF